MSNFIVKMVSPRLSHITKKQVLKIDKMVSEILGNYCEKCIERYKDQACCTGEVLILSSPEELDICLDRIDGDVVHPNIMPDLFIRNVRKKSKHCCFLQPGKGCRLKIEGTPLLFCALSPFGILGDSLTIFPECRMIPTLLRDYRKELGSSNRTLYYKFEELFEFASRFFETAIVSEKYFDGIVFYTVLYSRSRGLQ